MANSKFIVPTFNQIKKNTQKNINDISVIQQDLLAHDAQLQEITPKLNFRAHISHSFLSVDRAGVPNSIARGKCLGSTITEEQYNEIHNGTYNDMYAGVWWMLGTYTYVLAKLGASKTGQNGAILVTYRDTLDSLGISASTGYAGSSYYTNRMLGFITDLIKQRIPEEYIGTGYFHISTAIDSEGHVTAVKEVEGLAIAPCTMINLYGSNGGCAGDIPMIADRLTWYPAFMHAGSHIHGWGMSVINPVMDSYRESRVAFADRNGPGYVALNGRGTVMLKIQIV